MKENFQPGISRFCFVAKKFLTRKRRKNLSASFGVAGPVHDGVCQATNLPWMISAKFSCKRITNFKESHLINDLEANAWGLRCLSENEFAINQCWRRKESGIRRLISAGTGLEKRDCIGMEIPSPFCLRGRSLRFCSDRRRTDGASTISEASI